jgi:hypothetical protein
LIVSSILHFAFCILHFAFCRHDSDISDCLRFFREHDKGKSTVPAGMASMKQIPLEQLWQGEGCGGLEIITVTV